MAFKVQVPLTTLPTANEQAGASPVTVTATGNSREYPELGAFTSGIFFLDVSAASGTGQSLTVVIQGWNPIGEKWHPVVSFPAQTAATGTGVLAPISVSLDYQTYRAVWTVTGTATPSFTFSLGVIAASAEAAL